MPNTCMFPTAAVKERNPGDTSGLDLLSSLPPKLLAPSVLESWRTGHELNSTLRG